MDDAPRSTAPEPADPAQVPLRPSVVARTPTSAGDTILTGEDRGLPRLRRLWGAIPVVASLQAVRRPVPWPGSAARDPVHDARALERRTRCCATRCFGQLRKYPGRRRDRDQRPVRRHPRLDGDRGADERRRVPPPRPAVLSPGGQGDRPERRDHRQVPGRRDHGPVHPADDRPDARRSGDRSRARRSSAPSRTRSSSPAASGSGAGVHTGPAFVGTVGSDDKLDFTALGDTVNVAARLGSDAGAGELLVSATPLGGAGPGGRRGAPRARRQGSAEPLEVVVLGASTEVAVA